MADVVEDEVGEEGGTEENANACAADPRCGGQCVPRNEHNVGRQRVQRNQHDLFG